MLCFELHCSRIELGFVSTCHLCALLSVAYSDLIMLLSLMLASAVTTNYIKYLRVLYKTFVRPISGSIEISPAILSIGQDSAQLRQRGGLVTTELPRVSYWSEYLLVLHLRAEQDYSTDGSAIPKRSRKAMKLVLWPDSLSRADNKKLRRYLRFDCPNT